VASSAVLATQLSKAAGLLSAFACTMPALTAKYSMPAQHYQSENYAAEETYDRFHCLGYQPLTSHKFGPHKKMTNDKSRGANIHELGLTSVRSCDF
jgi:hypothetical protein